MKIEIELHELNLPMVERVPFLFSRQPACDCFEVALVGKLKNENSIFREYITDVLQCEFGIRHMMQRADHRGAIEKTPDERQFVDIRRHIDIALAVAKALTGLHELGP